MSFRTLLLLLCCLIAFVLLAGCRCAAGKPESLVPAVGSTGDPPLIPHELSFGLDERIAADGAVLRRPSRHELERLDAGSQTGRGVAARAPGPSLVARRRLGGVAVVLVDDVVTTGASASAAVRALRAAGAGTIAVRAVAVTPRRRPLSARTSSPR